MIRALINGVKRRLADESGVAGLLIAGLIMIVAFSALTIFLNSNIFQKGLRERPAATANVTKVRAALQAYAIANGRLPCPMATTQVGTGTEGNAAVTCTGGAVAYRGLVPWRTIGLSRSDALDSFGERYITYAVADVAANYVCATPLPIPTDTTENTMYLATNATGVATVSTTNRYIGMLVNHGEDGLGAANATNGTVVVSSDPTPTREVRNFVDQATSNRIFSAAPTNLDQPTTATADADYFDDIVYPIEYGTAPGQFRLCTDFANDAKDLRGPGRTDDTDMACTTSGCTGALDITSVSGPTTVANATLKGVGGATTSTGTAGNLSFGVGNATVEFNEFLSLGLDISFDHFAIRVTPSGATSTAVERDILVTAYNGTAKVGSRILPGGPTVGTMAQYASVGFGGAKFNGLTFTIANPNTHTAGFSLDGFALCSSTYPCARDTTTAQQALTTAFYETGGSLWATQIATEGTAGADSNLVATPNSYINAGGVVAMATTTALRVADGQASHVLGPYTPAGDIRDLTHVGGDIFFVTEDGTADRIYVARRSVDYTTVPATPAVTYAPVGVVTATNQPLYTCQDETMVAVYDAMFFKASTSSAAPNGSCGLWRMNQGVSYALPLTIPGTMSTNNLMFEGQGRLFVELDVVVGAVAYGNELVRYSPLGSATVYTIIDTDAGTSGSSFPSLATFRPITLPGTDNFLDTLYYRADPAGGTNYSLYVLYKDNAALISGAFSSTPHVVNLGGGALGSTTGVGTGTVLATVESNNWVYYVQARQETGGEEDAFRMTVPDGDTATADVTCWGLDSGTTPTLAVTNGQVYAIVSGILYKGDSGDFDSNCETGMAPHEVEADPSNRSITGASGLYLTFGGTGGATDRDSIAGSIFSSGDINLPSAEFSTEAVFVEAAASDGVRVVDGTASPGICSDTAGTAPAGPIPLNRTMVQDYLVFTANTDSAGAGTCTGTRQIFYYTYDTAVGLPDTFGSVAVTPTAGFLPLNESATPRAWSP